MSRSSTPATAALTAALELADRGLPCFPCSYDKKPTTAHGFKDATADQTTLRALWDRSGGPLIGVPTGEASGLDALDLDIKHGGGDWYAECRARLPSTRVHRTRSGGLHLLFQHKVGLRCSASRIAPGVDVRAEGGYLIWWPATGLAVLNDARPAPWPEWLHKETPRAPMPMRSVVPSDFALLQLIRAVAEAPQGQRNSLTFWAACRAGEMVASGMLSADTAAAIIAEAATRAGLPFSEAERTAWSGIRASGGVRS